MKSIHSDIQTWNSSLPEPIALNCWKHHLGYVKSFILSQSIINFNNINEPFQYNKDSLTDFYIGDLDCINISNQVINHSDLLGIKGISQYRNWLTNRGVDYKCIQLSDGSSWTLRLGKDERRYIHIHPSRYSPNTVRIRRSTLTTAIAYICQFGIQKNVISLEKVNFARKEFTKLPFVKPSSSLTAISRVLHLFFS